MKPDDDRRPRGLWIEVLAAYAAEHGEIAEDLARLFRWLAFFLHRRGVALARRRRHKAEQVPVRPVHGPG